VNKLQAEKYNRAQVSGSIAKVNQEDFTYLGQSRFNQTEALISGRARTPNRNTLDRSNSRSGLKSPRYMTSKPSMPSLINSTGIDLMQCQEEEQQINEYLRAELEAARSKR